ncbi:MAG: hypothetical protein HQK54_09190 [Oligoflexales bacterium]|nr:hypothetical protein [Oligoflexales bacterium]
MLRQFVLCVCAIFMVLSTLVCVSCKKDGSGGGKTPQDSGVTPTPSPTGGASPGTDQPSASGDATGESAATTLACYLTTPQMIKFVELPSGKSDPLKYVSLSGEPSPSDIIVYKGFAWAVGGKKLHKINMSTKALETSKELGHNLSGVTPDGDFLWLADNGGGTTETRPRIIRIAIATLEIDRTIEAGEVSDNYIDIAAESDGLWILIGNGFSIGHVKPSGEIRYAKIDDGKYGYGNIALDDSDIWVVNDYKNSLVRFKRSDLSKVSEQPVEAAEYSDMISIGKRLYLTAYKKPQVYVVDKDPFKVTVTALEDSATSMLASEAQFYLTLYNKSRIAIYDTSDDKVTTAVDNFAVKRCAR